MPSLLSGSSASLLPSSVGAQGVEWPVLLEAQVNMRDGMSLFTQGESGAQLTPRPLRINCQSNKQELFFFGKLNATGHRLKRRQKDQWRNNGGKRAVLAWPIQSNSQFQRRASSSTPGSSQKPSGVKSRSYQRAMEQTLPAHTDCMMLVRRTGKVVQAAVESGTELPTVKYHEYLIMNQGRQMSKSLYHVNPQMPLVTVKPGIPLLGTDSPLRSDESAKIAAQIRLDEALSASRLMDMHLLMPPARAALASSSSRMMSTIMSKEEVGSDYITPPTDSRPPPVVKKAASSAAAMPSPAAGHRQAAAVPQAKRRREWLDMVLVDSELLPNSKRPSHEAATAAAAQMWQQIPKPQAGAAPASSSSPLVQPAGLGWPPWQALPIALPIVPLQPDSACLSIPGMVNSAASTSSVLVGARPMPTTVPPTMLIGLPTSMLPSGGGSMLSSMGAAAGRKPNTPPGKPPPAIAAPYPQANNHRQALLSRPGLPAGLGCGGRALPMIGSTSRAAQEPALLARKHIVKHDDRGWAAIKQDHSPTAATTAPAGGGPAEAEPDEPGADAMMSCASTLAALLG